MKNVKKYNDFIGESSKNSKKIIKVTREESDKIIKDFMKHRILHWYGNSNIKGEPDFIETPKKDLTEKYALFKITGYWPGSDDEVSSFWNGTATIEGDDVCFVADI